MEYRFIHIRKIFVTKEREELKITFTLFSACAYPIVSSNLINVFTRKKKIKPSRRGEIEKNYPRLLNVALSQLIENLEKIGSKNLQ